MTTHSKAFMQQVVDEYTSPQELPYLAEYCFVFPNRRSIAFFKKYLIEKFNEIGNPAFIPSFTTISDLVARYSHGAEASRNELLFALYDTYRTLLKEKKREEQLPDFDRFRFWGEMILNDFNDVDLYMVSPQELFKNVKDLKEITADYLTPEQKEVMNRLWGDNSLTDAITASQADVEKFWMHTIPYAGQDDSVTSKFLRLWELLFDLYEAFRKRLRKRGLNYSGMAYREAAERIRKTEASEFPFKRYIFIGFNVLSTSEMMIFDRLKDIGAADFYWDFSSPAFFNDYESLKSHPALRASMINFHNRATHFVGRNIIRYPSLHPYPFIVDTKPEIHVRAIPGNTAQTKEVNRLLSEWSADEDIIPDTNNALETCVVVNDESLFIPLLHSIPESIGAINITLGLPVRHTEIATFITSVISMQLRKRMVRGSFHFYYEDILAVANHPLILGVAAEESTKLQAFMQQRRLYTADVEELNKEFPELAFIFSAVADNRQADEVYNYTSSLLSRLAEMITESKDSDRPIEGSDRHLAIIEYYLRELKELRALTEYYNIDMSHNSYFQLVKSLINSSTLNFVGKPLKGLQLMSLLETRTIDFRNLIILSMNERIFPKKHFAKTFIPNSLRKGYGLSTIEHQESIFAYYFYRLLTRAEKVELLYDSRTAGISSGEMSRYIYQLKYLRPYDNITFHALEYKPSSADKRIIEVPKKEEDMKRFLEGGDLRLSASALKTYAHCPLQFYLRFVKRWNCDSEDNEYMGAITYGNIIHHVMQKLYETVRGDANMVRITPDVLDSMIKMRHPESRLNLIEHLVREEINASYHHLPEEKLLAPLAGESKLLGSIMEKSIARLLDREKALTPFCFWRAEYTRNFNWQITPELNVNFRMAVDRIDAIEDSMSYRFIDYKTGADEVSLGAVDKLLDPSKNYQAVFQLLTYAEAFCALTGKDVAVQPMVYRLRSVIADGLTPVTYSVAKGKKDILGSQQQVRDTFMPFLQNLVTEIFDTSKPFTQAEKDDNCGYCPFTGICDRKTNSSY